MFKFLLSKKGFTITEIFTVVTILAILTAVAVPLFHSGIKKQHQNECQNNRTIISTAVEQVMYGMVDNGKKQESLKDENGNIIRYALDFNNSKIQGDHKATYPAVAVKDEDVRRIHDTTTVITYTFPVLEEEKTTEPENPVKTENPQETEKPTETENPQETEKSAFVDVAKGEYYSPHGQYSPPARSQESSHLHRRAYR